MLPFLKNIAKAYTERYRSLDEFCFIFPNKRAGTFFLKYLNEETAGRVSLSPEVITISDFAYTLSGRIPTARIDLIFRLYRLYTSLMAKREDGREAVSFDAFRGWGEVVLSDFNDVDLSDADIDQIFLNVTRYREIQSNFLTEEQREVIEEYFGVASPEADVERFWKHIDYRSKSADPARRETEVKERFLHLWEVLADLYHALEDDLEKEGLAYSGMASRLALEALREHGRDIVPSRKLVFVGFNVLSGTERRIFDLLKKMRTEVEGSEEPFADFVWDVTGPVMTDPKNTSMRFVRKNIMRFPKPQWLDLSESDAHAMPQEMKVVSSPGNAVQTAITGEVLAEWLEKMGDEKFREAKVAVVLPDESLLLPLLYRLPEGLDTVNLTMGYSLRLTSAASYVSLLTRLQMRKRRVASGEFSFLYEDLSLLLSHPFMHAMLGSVRIAKAKKVLAQERRFVVSPTELANALERSTLPASLTPLEPDTATGMALDYLETSLNEAMEALTPDNTGLVKGRLDVDNIRVYLQAVARLRDAVEEYEMDMNYLTLFSMVGRLLGAETVNFEGEPLQGLQIAGILETRCLDFEYLIIPSMNERIFPKKRRSKSFIPISLRHAYGLPTPRYEESIFAYYFYRMIARAKNVVMTYDSRTSGLRSGDVSRYVLQLRHLYAQGFLKEESRRFTLTTSVTPSYSVRKSDRILEKLNRYFVKDSGMRFSASSLQNYLTCPLKFYYANVERISDNPEPEEYMSRIELGNILHATMMDVYLPEDLHNQKLTNPIPFSAEKVQAIIDDRGCLERILRRNVNKEYLKLPREEWDRELTGDALLTAEMLLKQITAVLEHDRDLAPFHLIGCEIKDTFQMKFSPKYDPANFTFAIDRVDSVDSTRQTRIIDYKTGSAHVAGEEVWDMFNSDFKSKHAFQLMLYSNFYNMHYHRTPHDGTGQEDYPISPLVYQAQNMKLTECPPKFGPSRGQKAVTDHTSINDTFMDGFRTLMEEIFDKDVDFLPTDREENCQYCAFVALCHK